MWRSSFENLKNRVFFDAVFYLSQKLTIQTKQFLREIVSMQLKIIIHPAEEYKLGIDVSVR